MLKINKSTVITNKPQKAWIYVCVCVSVSAREAREQGVVLGWSRERVGEERLRQRPERKKSNRKENKVTSGTREKIWTRHFRPWNSWTWFVCRVQTLTPAEPQAPEKLALSGSVGPADTSHRLSPGVSPLCVVVSQICSTAFMQKTVEVLMKARFYSVQQKLRDGSVSRLHEAGLYFYQINQIPRSGPPIMGPTSWSLSDHNMVFYQADITGTRWKRRLKSVIKLQFLSLVSSSGPTQTNTWLLSSVWMWTLWIPSRVKLQEEVTGI